MGVSSCSGPQCKGGVAGCTAGWGGGICREPTSSSTFAVNVDQCSHLVCEEYKHSAWVQSLLITPKTGFVNSAHLYKLGR